MESSRKGQTGSWRQRLINEAMRQQSNAYCPYSHFAAGAAILLRDNRIIGGCNVENAAFGSTICAERGAIMRAFAQDAKADSLCAIAVIGPAETPVTPCGACRQMLAEFSPPQDPIVVYCCSRGGVLVEETTLTELLPHQFPSPEERALIGR